MQLAIVSNGLRVISRGTTDGNAIGLFGADETVRSLCRDELMAEVGGGMEEDAGRGGDPSIGRKGYTHPYVTPYPLTYNVPICAIQRKRDQRETLLVQFFLVAALAPAVRPSCCVWRGGLHAAWFSSAERGGSADPTT